MSEFQHVKDFISVGVGPLFLGDDFVESGRPDSSLKGDTKFVAQQMNVTCPPVPVRYQEEKKIFNHFLERHPTPTYKSFIELAKEFRERVDCKRIFPKLPTMLKLHHKKWEQNNEKKMLQREMEEDFDKFLETLGEGAPEKQCTVASCASGPAGSGPESAYIHPDGFW